MTKAACYRFGSATALQINELSWLLDLGSNQGPTD
jgi:hypothetical protein